jgi:hypothetical protein
MRRLWREVVAALVLGVMLGGCAGSVAKTTPSQPAPGKRIASESRPSAQAGAPLQKTAEARKPRKHHYLFAHRLLPRIFFSDTDPLVMRFKADPQETIVRFWNSVGESIPSDERLSSDGLSAEYSVRADGVRIVFVTLPLAEVSPEAIFAVLAIRGRERWYLTYERSNDPSAPGREIAILCGWNSAGEHLNYGLHDNYSRSAFEKLLEKYLAGLPAPVAGINSDGKVWEK